MDVIVVAAPTLVESKWPVVVIMSWAVACTALDARLYTAWQAIEPWQWIQIAVGYITVFVTGKVHLLDALVRRILHVRQDADAPDAYYPYTHKVWKCQNILTAGRTVHVSIYHNEYICLGGIGKYCSGCSGTVLWVCKAVHSSAGLCVTV